MSGRYSYVVWGLPDEAAARGSHPMPVVEGARFPGRLGGFEGGDYGHAPSVREAALRILEGECPVRHGPLERGRFTDGQAGHAMGYCPACRCSWRAEATEGPAIGGTLQVQAPDGTWVSVAGVTDISVEFELGGGDELRDPGGPEQGHG